MFGRVTLFGRPRLSSPCQKVGWNYNICASLAIKKFIMPRSTAPAPKPKPKISFKRDPRLPKPGDPETPMPDDIDEFLKNFDTSLTPELREKVDRIKATLKGPNARPCMFLLTMLDK
jgi:hypothetical protein